MFSSRGDTFKKIWSRKENRIGAKKVIKIKNLDLIEKILTSNGFN
jgi:hypothetical protein